MSTKDSLVSAVADEPYSTLCNNIARACLSTTCARLLTIRNDYESIDASPGQFEMLPTLLRERFDPHFYHSDGIYLRSTGELYAQGVSRLLFDQLRADRNFIVHTLRATKNELQHKPGSFGTLMNTVSVLQEHQADELAFIEEYARNVLMLRRLRRQVARLEKATAAKSADDAAAALVVRPPLFDETHMRNALRLRFTRNWESARQAQQHQQCRANELEYRAQIAATQQRIDYEIRCKVEVDMFMSNKIEIMNQDCVKWMEKFDLDYETAEVDIQVAIEQLDELHKTRDERQAQFEMQRHCIDEFYRKKAEREEFERCLIKYTKNALILQIWYRAFMVRYGLGPYKRKKPKKAKKK